MSTSGPTSMYDGYLKRDVQQPDVDSPQQDGDGDDGDHRGVGDSHPPRDDHGIVENQWASGQQWWSDGWQRQWGHSWGNDSRNWDRSGWAQDVSSSAVQDGTWYDSRPWGSTSTGTGSLDGGQDRDSKDSSLDAWGRHVSGSDSRTYQGGGRQPDGWRPSTDAQGTPYEAKRGEFSRGPSEKMIVPSFSGLTPSSGDDLGTSARSYLRQVSAWRRMTRMSEDQQALTLYQHLTDRAWVDAERLDMDKLGSKCGVDYLVEWVKDRYLDVQVTQIGRSLSGFFRSLHRKTNQSIRDYMAEFDRAHSRLQEVGCQLPDVAVAWVFVDRMGLEEQAELNLLASVGNQHSSRKDWAPRKPFSANLAGVDENGSYEVYEAFELDEGNEDAVPEEVAQELYQAYMTHESAKQRYRENAKLRGSDPDSLKQLASDKLKAAKARSFCAGCKRRGHWHKDSVCPLNQANAGNSGTSGNKAGSSTATVGKDNAKAMYPCHVVHVTWEIEGFVNKDLLAITDTACSRSVAGAAWVDSYLAEARKMECDPQFTSCREAFKFGASKVFVASYGIILCFELGGFRIGLRVAVVNGDVPLLVSRGALGKMGMLLDVAENKASFKALGVYDMELEITETGHPAFQIRPAPLPKCFGADSKWESTEIVIFPQGEQYTSAAKGKGCDDVLGDDASGSSASSGSLPCMTSWMVSSMEVGDEHGGGGERDALPEEPRSPKGDPGYCPLFYPKKIGLATKNFLLDPNFNPTTFATWWSSTSISNDFWIERAFMLCLARATESFRKCTVCGKPPVMMDLFRFFGSAEVSFVDDFRCPARFLPALFRQMAQSTDLLTAPVVTRAKTLSEFTKAELLAEAQARNLWVHQKWTVTELRSAIQEDRRNPSANHPANVTKGMGSMTLEDLKIRAMEMNYLLPQYATRGTIMRILRDQGGMGPDSILGFGRFKGKAYKDTPVSYRTWAVREVESNDNPSEDLVLYANWWKGEMHKWNPETQEIKDPFDAEECATIPYVDDGSSTASWDLLHREALAVSQAATPKSKAAGYPVQAPRMDQEVPPEISDEMRCLEVQDGGAEEFYDCEEAHPDGDNGAEEDDENYDDFLYHLDFDESENQPRTLGEPTHEAMVTGGSGDVVQRKATGTKAAEAETCEMIAREKLNLKLFTYEDLLELARTVPLRRTPKGKGLQRGGGGSLEYFLAGMYTYGPMSGISKASQSLPWTVKYMNSFMKVQGFGQWSSFVLFKNAATSVHADVHNLPNTTVKTVSFGPFSGGELWMSDSDRATDTPGTQWRTDAQGNLLPGYNVKTKNSVYTFNGKIKHATQPWDGERWTLSCFTTRGFQQSTVAERDQLRDLRFPLRGIPLRPPECDEDPPRAVRHRPMKSIRKGLWKKASRLAALTTWCTMAGTSCTATHYPLSRGPEAVAFFEIGGFHKTLEITDLNYLAAEPYGYSHGGEDPQPIEAIYDTIREFNPAVVWLHAKTTASYVKDITGYLCEHVDQGRQLAIEATPDDPCWENEGIKDLLARYDGKWHHRCEEPDVLRVNDDYRQDHRHPDDEVVPEFHAYVTEYKPEVEDGNGADGVAKTGAEAISFEKGKNLASEVKSSLRRLHQNLGHPSNTDLARHLRLAGADPVVVDACKRLQCQVCQRNKRGATPKPASLPNLLEFNQVVAVDAFYVYDCDGEKVELMTAIDVGTGFALAGELRGHSTRTMEDSFCALWSNTFGAPGTLVVDLESGLQAGLARFSEWHGSYIRPIAGQAHWQNGTVERAIRTWKEVWSRLVDERSATSDEANMVVTAVNNAMNTLRRDAGFSPAQAVWGRDPRLPEDVHNSFQDDHVEHIISRDRQRAREHTVRIAAKEAYFKVRNDAKLRKGLLQRSRVGGPELDVGCHVFFYRKPKNNKNWVWHGPGVVIGREGPNYWVSFSGRCHLVAPEHLRLASSEELGAAFTLRSTKEDLEKLLEQDFGDEELYDQTEEMDVDPELPPGDDHQDGDGVDGPHHGRQRGESSRRRDGDPPAPVTKRHRTKGPEVLENSDPHATFMMKLPKTPRGREKALEKEIPWSMVPEDQKPNFRQAERKQYDEHREHGALDPLSVEDSRRIARERPERVLNSRFAYRDKHWSRRRESPDVGWKPKARLVIAGHRDPDLLSGLPTHAPTISRQGIHLLLQILASNLNKGWKGYAGDVTAAFLCGEDLERELYLRQPKTGLGDLHPEQLLRIRKPIFGLVDSPAAWWTKFHRTLKGMKIRDGDTEWMVVQSTLDHCVFMVQKVTGYDENGEPRLEAPSAYLGVHVDDVLLGRLSAEFPIQDWEEEKFEYVGSFIEILEDRVKVTQASYANTRLFQVDVERSSPDHFEASEIEKHDNQSLIGALSWMASQTRPDLQVGVSMCQQCQKSPTVGDVRFTNQLARRAMEHKEEGLTFFPVNLDCAVLLCYHDAGWANVPQNDEDPFYKLTDEENLQGRFQDGPLARREAKMKKTNSTIASQLGGLYVLADDKILSGGESHGSILDWRSGACERVCRSTFAAETMACGTATETGDFIAKFLETLLTGKLARNSTRFQIRFLSDCRSLYDHLTRDGVPRVPTCKRLSIDLAAIRQDLKSFGRIAWVPTWAQLADLLTKPLRPESWWETIKSPLKLTFREEGGKTCIDKVYLEPV
ncbi:GIP [Symbiodinium sp. CCMP2592]|nr:GIP [Symbiodinium sp. CCMP2592]